MSKVWILLSVLITLNGVVNLANAQSRCTNPNQNSGTCISLYDCPTLLTLFQTSNLPEPTRTFLSRSQCTTGSGRYPHVCCTSDSGPSTPTSGQTSGVNPTRAVAQPSNGKGNVLPTPPNCGPNPIGDKIYGGKDTGLDEYVWMALLEFTGRNGRKSLNCAGSLINQRYVLTAAHCVTGEIIQVYGPLTGVRLGEYDTSKTSDCLKGECADPIVEVGIEEIIPHPEYNQNSPNKYNDIALLRLDRDVAYSAYLYPVCLPFVAQFTRSAVGTNVTVAGWGRTLHSQTSPIRQKLAIPINDPNECKQKFAAKNVNIADSQICAGGRYIEDSCDGDSGGPLMKFVNIYWVLEGIVSFGNKCGLDGWPGIYTRVASYDSWIRSNMKP